MKTKRERERERVEKGERIRRVKEKEKGRERRGRTAGWRERKERKNRRTRVRRTKTKKTTKGQCGCARGFKRGRGGRPERTLELVHTELTGPIEEQLNTPSDHWALTDKGKPVSMVGRGCVCVCVCGAFVECRKIRKPRGRVRMDG